MLASFAKISDIRGSRCLAFLRESSLFLDTNCLFQEGSSWSSGSDQVIEDSRSSIFDLELPLRGAELALGHTLRLARQFFEKLNLVFNLNKFNLFYLNLKGLEKIFIFAF